MTADHMPVLEDFRVPSLKSPGMLLAAFWAGHFFASDAPLVNVTCGRSIMGETLKRKKGASVRVAYECVDSLGLQRVRVIADGKAVTDLWPRHEQVVKGSCTCLLYTSPSPRD